MGFDVDALGDLIQDTTAVFRKGQAVVIEQTGGVQATHFYGYPHVDEASAEWDLVDCHFVTVGVHKERAERREADLMELLREYPEPERLKGGPSYIEVGAALGSQEYALRVFALGQVLGMWGVMTPERLGVTGKDADDLAGKGFVMMTGWDVS